MSLKQLIRRDFLFGATAGVASTVAVQIAREDAYVEGQTRCYAQCGEDLVVAGILEHLKIKQPTYLDIGAFLPILANNTYLLYQAGGRGVLVEPNVDCISTLKSKRPGDVVLNVGVGLDDTEAADYFVMSLMQWNTFDKDEAEKRVRETEGRVKIERVVKMPLVNINRIILEHLNGRAPDYLSIDVEGLDLMILKTLKFEEYRPKVICTETLVTSTMRLKKETFAFLEALGYECRGQTFPNSIFVDKKLMG
jgi:FkbM family methyltransferase